VGGWGLWGGGGGLVGLVLSQKGIFSAADASIQIKGGSREGGGGGVGGGGGGALTGRLN